MVKSTPTLIAYRGKVHSKTMLQERVNKDEVYAMIWGSGPGLLEQAEAVLLETDGSITVS